MDTPPLPPQKKGLGPLAWVGIGCGGIIVLCLISVVVAYLVLGPKVKDFIQASQKDPTRAMATLMVNASQGQVEMVQQDEANHRYTIKETKTGRLTTFFWNDRKKAPDSIPGDFSAIPEGLEAAPVTAPPTPEPAPAPEAK